ncbi:hypothetical protein HDU67_002176 [Dinochytrium kinnereticum]|nr:hypothetical protein HDU67_002176 [Dinochytrium kinnereticum]
MEGQREKLTSANAVTLDNKDNTSRTYDEAMNSSHKEGRDKLTSRERNLEIVSSLSGSSPQSLFGTHTDQTILAGRGYVGHLVILDGQRSQVQSPCHASEMVSIQWSKQVVKLLKVKLLKKYLTVDPDPLKTNEVIEDSTAFLYVMDYVESIFASTLYARTGKTDTSTKDIWNALGLAICLCCLGRLHSSSTAVS